MLLLGAFVAGGCRPQASSEPGAELAFLRDGRPVGALSREALAQRIPAETFRAYDPYYQRVKGYRALPLRAVLEAGFGAAEPGEEYVLRARDGYTVPLSGERLLEPGGYLAVEDLDVPGWEPIGPQRANPGPFYLVWKGAEQQDLAAHPRPWQLASIERARFEAVFPHTAPTGAPPGSPPARGYAIFREECVRCHAMNREGGHAGPDLNVPESIVEYRPVDQIRAYVRNPLTFRYGNMPAHPSLTDADLDALIAYFTAMKSLKHDGDAGSPSPP